MVDLDHARVSSWSFVVLCVVSYAQRMWIIKEKASYFFFSLSLACYCNHSKAGLHELDERKKKHTLFDRQGELDESAAFSCVASMRCDSVYQSLPSSVGKDEAFTTISMCLHAKQACEPFRQILSRPR